jgi:hypothetical protein
MATEAIHHKAKGCPRGVQFCTPENAQACFNKLNNEVNEAREKRLPGR